MLGIKNRKHLRKSIKPLIAISSALLCSAVLSTGINASSAGVVATDSGNLNVRSSPGLSGAVIDSIPKGSYMTLENQSNGWWYAEFDNGRYGYISAKYVQQLASTEGNVSTGGEYLNVRSGPGTSYQAVDALVDGAEVIVLGGSDNGWGLVLYDGDTSGYVNLRYISQADQPSSAAYSAVQLNVISYKQYDSRWSNMYIGSSGKTVKSIGCTVNCVAMAETYRNGYNITPAAIVSSSKFTSGGAYYWPGHYSKDYSSDYLSVIYRKLSEGKPVIFHSNASGGSSHWVIVTGFTGGNTLSADKFIINDPGSSVRTTLADHLKYYPIYSKLVYYS